MSSPLDAKPRIPERSLLVPEELVPERAATVSFLGSQTREGNWLLPRLFRIVTVFGNVELDLTKARVGAGTSRIEVRAVFGNVEITVPPEMRVESDGSGVFANFGLPKRRLSFRRTRRSSASAGPLSSRTSKSGSWIRMRQVGSTS